METTTTTTKYDDIEDGDRIKVEFIATVVAIPADRGGLEFVIEGDNGRPRFRHRTFWDDVIITKLAPPMPDHSCIGFGTHGVTSNVAMYYDHREGTIALMPSGLRVEGVTDFREATP